MSDPPGGVGRVVAWSAAAALVAATASVTPSVATGRDPERWAVTASMLAWLWFLAVFPSGQAQPRWVWLAAAAAAAGVVAGLPVAFILGFAVLASTQVWRYRRHSSVPDRQATKWLLLGLLPASGLFLGVGAVAALPTGPTWVLTHPAYAAASLAGMWAVPTAALVGLAFVDRGPVDELVRYTFIAVVTTVGVALVHAVTTLWARGFATVSACASVIPLALLANRVATKLAYSRGPQQAVRLLPLQLAGTTAAAPVAPVVASAIRNALASPSAQVRMGTEVLAGSGDESMTMTGVPVLLHDDVVATLAAAPRLGEPTLSARDIRVLHAIAIIAAPALAGARAARAAEEAHRQAANAREHERDRLHADLHDELGPALSGLALTAAAISTLLGSNDVTTARRLTDDLRAGIGTTAIRVREVAYDLRPANPTPSLFAELLLERLGGEPAPALTVDVEPENLTLPDDLQLALIRVVLEAVTNVRRHAGAATCAVDIRLAGREVRVTVDDDGTDPAGTHRGIGLQSIAQRTASFGGQSLLTQRPGGGARLTATFITPDTADP
ncbi:sensor histidine kinase [Oryzobacter terrae]|uniref:sensor histidine kinase n=1 Tax=Oryzobacter terrae TaxID=1620385 RepID=UPI00366DDDA1